MGHEMGSDKVKRTAATVEMQEGRGRGFGPRPLRVHVRFAGSPCRPALHGPLLVMQAFDRVELGGAPCRPVAEDDADDGADGHDDDDRGDGERRRDGHAGQEQSRALRQTPCAEISEHGSYDAARQAERDRLDRKSVV